MNTEAVILKRVVGPSGIFYGNPFRDDLGDFFGTLDVADGLRFLSTRGIDFPVMEDKLDQLREVCRREKVLLYIVEDTI